MRHEDVVAGRLYLGWVPRNVTNRPERVLFKFIVKEGPFFRVKSHTWMARGRLWMPSIPLSSAALKDPIDVPCDQLLIEAGVVE